MLELQKYCATDTQLADAMGALRVRTGVAIAVLQQPARMRLRGDCSDARARVVAPVVPGRGGAGGTARDPWVRTSTAHARGKRTEVVSCSQPRKCHRFVKIRNRNFCHPLAT